MFSATKWVPRGYAAEFPVKYDLNDEEMDRIAHLAELQLEDAKQALADEETTNGGSGTTVKSSDAQVDNDDDLKEYNLDTYDDDEVLNGEEDDEEAAGPQKLGIFNNIKSLAYYAPGEKDPYIELPETGKEDDLDDDKDDLQIMPTDNLVLATRTEDDVSYLEVYVYDNTALQEDDDDDDNDQSLRKSNSLYVHHDFMLPSFPLCVEWINYDVGKQPEENNGGNYVAIGTFEPQIELWNLDVVDSAYPDMILGQAPEASTAGKSSSSKKKNKKNKQRLVNDSYHVDAVLSLASNPHYRHLLASGSADTTIKLWDLSKGLCAKSYSIHDGKVSSVAFNPTESTALLSGGYDRYARVTDLRVEGPEGQLKFKVDSDVEGVKWSSNGYEFYVSTELGVIHKFDARASNGSSNKPLWSLQAHDSEITTFDINTYVDDFMVTGSSDKTVKLWNLSSNKGPSMILSRDFDIGRVFTTSFAPDRAVFGHIAIGGSSGTLQVWDSLSNRTVREILSKKTKIDSKAPKREIIATVANDAAEEEEVDEELIMEAEANGEVDDDEDDNEEEEY